MGERSGFVYARQVSRPGGYVYGEWCDGATASAMAADEAEFRRIVDAAACVVCWGGVAGPAVLDLKAMFERRHDFSLGLAAFGPFSSSKHVEQLREFCNRVREHGRARWTTRAGLTKFWYDPAFATLKC